MGDVVRVLHVDDDPDLVDLASTFLERDNDDLQVETATSIDEGLTLLDTYDIDCIVSDYDMPGQNGIEFLQTVRERYPDLPFLLFTGKGSEEIASEAISAGVTDYLQKGGGADQYTVLANRIRNAVEKYWIEHELDTTRRQYQQIVEQNLVGIYIIQDGEFIYVNPKLAEIHDYDRETLIGMSPIELIAPDERDRVRENLQRRIEGDVEEMQYQTVGLTRSGERIDIELHGSRIEYGDGTAVMGAELDITERKERERERQETNRQLQAVLNTVDAAIFIKDTDYQYQLMNQECRRLAGLDSDEDIIGLTDYDVFPDELAARYRADDQRVLRNEKTIKVREDVSTQNGTKTSVTTKSPFYDEDGELLGVCGVSTKLSDPSGQDSES